MKSQVQSDLTSGTFTSLTKIPKVHPPEMMTTKYCPAIALVRCRFRPVLHKMVLSVHTHTHTHLSLIHI